MTVFSLFSKISDYFLNKICNILDIKTKLTIIKYNKKIQNKCGLTIKNYKEYSEIYSPIEIEIIPSFTYEEPFIQICGEDFQVCEGIHIYFDNNKEEVIGTNCLYYDDSVSKIKIIIDYRIKSFENLFYGCNGAKEIRFKKFYRNNINNMSFLFYDCQSLEKIVFSNFNTNNVADMSFMFYRCSMIKALNFSCFNTKNVTNMKGMFSESGLNTINISNFNTDNLTDMAYMFS